MYEKCQREINERILIETVNLKYVFGCLARVICGAPDRNFS